LIHQTKWPQVWGHFVLASKLKLGEMFRDEFCHLKHVDDGFAIENFFEVLVSIDVAFIARVLEIFLLNVNPELLDDLGAGHWSFADDDSEVFADGHGLHKRGIRIGHDNIVNW